MGVYLSSPVTEKESIDGECERFVYGASSMQGWRITQEDAHNCIPLFDEKTQTSFFAVYDGHGGSEVAKYCEKHFPDFVKKLIEAESNTDDPTSFIKNAFLAFDATLTSEEVIKELKELAGKDDDNEEEEEDDPVGYSETDMLKKEADMPLDQLLAQYKSYVPDKLVNSHKKEIFQSPALKAKIEAASGDGNAGEVEGTGSSSVSSSSPSSCKQNSSPALPNGAGDFNISNTSDQSQTKDTISKNFQSSEKHMNNNNSIDDNITSNCNSISSSTTDDPSSPSSPNKAHTEATGSQHGCELSPGGSQAVVTSGSLSSQTDCSVIGSLPSADSGDGPSGSGISSSVGIKSRKAKAAVDMVDGVIDSSDDDDDDDDEDEGDVWEDMSDDDDDDEEEEEEEDEPDDDVPMMDMSNEEPGSDSGCTACVVLIKDKKLFVANAGDSRCVLSKGGKAVDLSYDHKPEDDSERERIENAGGKVTADGRVNGGLNLSRAIGDHVYKRNKDLSAEEQMITALPDVETAELSEEDQFIVIACDGIWNYMSSQEVVDYILEKLKEPENRQKPSLICEQLFDHCLAPNTCGDGTGCDNMTCIIIVLNTFTNSLAQHAPPQAAQTEETADNNREDMTPEQQLSDLNKTELVASGNLKRCTDNSEIREEKRLKVTEEAA